MLKRVLLGVTRDNTMVFADIECKDYLSISFSEVQPIEVDDDYLRECIRDLVEFGMGDEVVLGMLKKYDCKPSELVDVMMNFLHIEEIIDISLYPESFDGIVKDKTIYFESMACGQLDIDTRDLIPIDKKFFDMLTGWWDEYHLKEDYPKEQIVCTVEDYLHRLDERQWIENWLRSLYPVEEI